MKKIIVLAAFAVFCSAGVWAQDNSHGQRAISEAYRWVQELTAEDAQFLAEIKAIDARVNKLLEPSDVRLGSRAVRNGLFVRKRYKGTNCGFQAKIGLS